MRAVFVGDLLTWVFPNAGNPQKVQRYPREWAAALREMSGRLEEIPGEEAFPAYLESVIAGFYERGGLVRLKSGAVGSITIGGTVSPAGGNFDEPVTQSTLVPEVSGRVVEVDEVGNRAWELTGIDSAYVFRVQRISSLYARERVAAAGR